MNKSKGVNYEAAKAAALSLEPFQEKVQLNQVEIDTDGQLSIKGIAVRVDNGVVEKQLLNQILKISPQFSKRVEKLSTVEVKKSLVNLLKAGLSLTSKDASITIIGNPQTQSVTNIMPGKKDFISNRFALKMFEDTMNSQPDLTLVGFENTYGG
ncbi:MAG: hypothetical protein ABIP51_15685, partial [Bacteroidia bacterium]